MQKQLLSLFMVNSQEVMTCQKKIGIGLKACQSITLLISGDIVSVTCKYLFIYLLVESPKIEQNKDYEDYKQFIQGKNVVTINALGRAGWTTHKEGFPKLPDQRNRTAARAGSEVPHQPFDPIKTGPIATEKKYQQNVDFARLSDGFKRILCNSNDEKEMKVPIVGFAGHQKGIKARNFYGKAFRETSLASKKVLRSTINP